MNKSVTSQFPPESSANIELFASVFVKKNRRFIYSDQIYVNPVSFFCCMAKRVQQLQKMKKVFLKGL